MEEQDSVSPLPPSIDINATHANSVSAQGTPTPTAATPSAPSVDPILLRLNKTFLGALDKQSENHIVTVLQESLEAFQHRTVDINQVIKASTGATFLHLASQSQKRAVCTWLLEHGADPNIPNAKGNSALAVICDQADKPGALELIQLFVDFGANIWQQNNEQQSSVDKAKQFNLDISQFKAGQKEQPKADTGPAQADVDKANCQLLHHICIVLPLCNVVFLSLLCPCSLCLSSDNEETYYTV